MEEKKWPRTVEGEFERVKLLETMQDAPQQEVQRSANNVVTRTEVCAEPAFKATIDADAIDNTSVGVVRDVLSPSPS